MKRPEIDWKGRLTQIIWKEVYPRPVQDKLPCGRDRYHVESTVKIVRQACRLSDSHIGGNPRYFISWFRLIEIGSEAGHANHELKVEPILGGGLDGWGWRSGCERLFIRPSKWWMLFPKTVLIGKNWVMSNTLNKLGKQMVLKKAIQIRWQKNWFAW